MAHSAWGVVGLGNPLMGDDGVGPFIVTELLRHRPGLYALELGTDLLGIQSHRPYPARLLIVDAVHTGAPPGQIHRWDRSTVTRIPRSSSAHQLSALEVLRLMDRMDNAFAAVEWRWIGIEVAGVEFGQGLSGPVRAAAGHLVAVLIG